MAVSWYHDMAPILFCSRCGAQVRLEVPEGDNRERHVCATCGHIHYENPRIVVGAVCVWEDRILLCRRAIEPRSGFWTVPAGFMECGESAEEGAAREALEEALATIEIESLLGAYSVPRIGQVHLFYSARLAGGRFGVGHETLESRLVRYEDIPWDEIAFPSVEWALRLHHDYQASARLSPTEGTTGIFKAPPKIG